MSNNLVKRLLSEFLSFLLYKIDNDLLTMEEMDSLSKTVETNLKLIGTVDDFAKFYDQPRTNISSVIHLAVAIASELGVDLEGEEPAYIAGDSARDLADVICALGCRCG